MLKEILREVQQNKEEIENFRQYYPYEEKLSMLKESYFEKQPSRATRLPEENVQEVTETGVAKGEADMVADAITRHVKSSDW